MKNVYRNKKKYYLIKSNYQINQASYALGVRDIQEIDDETKEALIELGVSIEDFASGADVSIETVEGNDYDSSMEVEIEIETNFWSKVPPIANQEISDGQLDDLGYPRYQESYVDTIVTDDGDVRRFLNPEKYLDHIKMPWIRKILSVEKLDKLTFDKPFFNKIAEKNYAYLDVYNNVSPRSQYLMDNETNKITLAKKISIKASAFILIFLIAFPAVAFSQGTSALASNNFSKAETAFKLAFTKSSNKMYSRYASALKDASNSDYETAVAKMESLIPHQPSLQISVVKGLEEIKYQEAISYYKADEFKKAMDVFESIKFYGNSKEYYNESGYALGEERYSNKDIVGAIDSFYRVKDYQDAEDRGKQLSAQLYSRAKELYNLGDFDSAEKEFLKISSYDYKDSADMANRSIYKKGIGLMDVDPDASKNIFTEIYSYQDSSALSKELLYKEAMSMSPDKYPDKAIQLMKLGDYRSSKKELASPALSLYGGLSITERDGQKIPVVDIKFNHRNEFISDQDIDGIAVSTTDAPRKYEFKDGRYVYVDSNYTYTVKTTKATDTELTFEVTYDNKKHEYKALRRESIVDIAEKDKEVSFSDKDRMIEELTKYINSKLDFKVNLNGEAVEISLIGDYLTPEKSSQEEVKPDKETDDDVEAVEPDEVEEAPEEDNEEEKGE